MSDGYIVTTDSGHLVRDQRNESKAEDYPALTEDEANSDAKARNDKAAKLGIKTRYEAREIA